jgi:hypothetical protein
MYKAQQAFDGVIANFPVRFIAGVVNRIIFPWGHPMSCRPTKSATRLPSR